MVFAPAPERPGPPWRPVFPNLISPANIPEEILADDPQAQFALLAAAYATEDDRAIDDAVAKVGWARRLKSTGLLDLFRDIDDAKR